MKKKQTSTGSSNVPVPSDRASEFTKSKFFICNQRKCDSESKFSLFNKFPLYVQLYNITWFSDQSSEHDCQKPCVVWGTGWRALRSLSKTKRAINDTEKSRDSVPCGVFLWCSKCPSALLPLVNNGKVITVISLLPINWAGQLLALKEWKGPKPKCVLQNCLFHLCLMSKGCSNLQLENKPSSAVQAPILWS